MCLAVEQLSRACATTGLILAVQELGALPLLLAGTPEQQARWFPRLASGEQLIAFALTEAEAGSDAAATRTRAVRDGDDYVITGSKRFISHGSVADLITVFAVTDPDASRHRRLTLLRRRGPAPTASASPGSSTRWASAAARPPSSPSTGFGSRRRTGSARRATGFDIAMRTFDRSRPGIAAQAVGIAQGALEVATAYAKERQQFGQRIGDLQMVGAMLADMDAGDRGGAPAPVQGLRRDRGRCARRQPVVGDV